MSLCRTGKASGKPGMPARGRVPQIREALRLQLSLAGLHCPHKQMLPVHPWAHANDSLPASSQARQRSNHAKFHGDRPSKKDAPPTLTSLCPHSAKAVSGR